MITFTVSASGTLDQNERKAIKATVDRRNDILVREGKTPYPASNVSQYRTAYLDIMSKIMQGRHRRHVIKSESRFVRKARREYPNATEAELIQLADLLEQMET